MSILGFSCTVLITWEGFLMYGHFPRIPEDISPNLDQSLRTRLRKVGGSNSL